MKEDLTLLEIVMTYGWAILIAIIVGAALYALGLFNPACYPTFENPECPMYRQSWHMEYVCLESDEIKIIQNPISTDNCPNGYEPAGIHITACNIGEEPHICPEPYLLCKKCIRRQLMEVWR